MVKKGPPVHDKLEMPEGILDHVQTRIKERMKTNNWSEFEVTYWLVARASVMMEHYSKILNNPAKHLSLIHI